MLISNLNQQYMYSSILLNCTPLPEWNYSAQPTYSTKIDDQKEYSARLATKNFSSSPIFGKAAITTIQDRTPRGPAILLPYRQSV